MRCVDQPPVPWYVWSSLMTCYAPHGVFPTTLYTIIQIIATAENIHFLPLLFRTGCCDVVSTLSCFYAKGMFLAAAINQVNNLRQFNCLLWLRWVVVTRVIVTQCLVLFQYKESILPVTPLEWNWKICVITCIIMRLIKWHKLLVLYMEGWNIGKWSNWRIKYWQMSWMYSCD